MIEASATPTVVHLDEVGVLPAFASKGLLSNLTYILRNVDTKDAPWIVVKPKELWTELDVTSVPSMLPLYDHVLDTIAKSITSPRSKLNCRFLRYTKDASTSYIDRNTWFCHRVALDLIVQKPRMGGLISVYGTNYNLGIGDAISYWATYPPGKSPVTISPVVEGELVVLSMGVTFAKTS